MTLAIRRPRTAGTIAAGAARVSGPGASGGFRCHAVSRKRILCVGAKHGPITIRGSFSVPAGTNCDAKASLNLWRWTGDFVAVPTGCPQGYPEQKPRPVGEIIHERAYNGLDLDLHGDRAAIVSRAKRLQRAWLRGDPVARWTSEEEAFGMPMFARDQVELEFRDLYREHFQDLIEGWVTRNASSTYAGYELDSAAGGIIYVGFTSEPTATLERLRRQLIAPNRFKPFPVPPRYTERELSYLESTLWPEEGPISELINETSLDILANKVRVGTEKVAKVRALLAEKYGPDAPFEVVFSEPLVLL